MYQEQLQAMILAAYKAEDKIKEVYHKNFDVEIKSDNSPVTEADKGADEIIRQTLSKQFPDYGFLTEESTDNKERLNKEFVFIIDPVDGTKEFVNRTGEFATCIALARNGEVVAGVINCPMRNVLYYASKNQGAFKLPKLGNPVKIHVNNRKDNLSVLRSVSFFNEKEQEIFDRNKDKICHVFPIGAAIKFCMIAEGLAESFVRCSSGTKEWDIAAGDIILSEAGGIMVEPNGEKFRYNREDVYNRNGYVMANCKENLLK